MNESTLVPREEMNDLDWLARNVHVWPFSMLDSKPTEDYVWHQPHCGGDILVVFRDRPSVFNKDQWLARRAELQSRPGWKGAPDWAEWLHQDGCGEWEFSEGKPTPYDGLWLGEPCKRSLRAKVGEVLGDWRDTLEKRPADLSKQAVMSRLKEATDNVIAAAPELMEGKYKFEPFVSVEDAKLTIMQSDGDVKHFGGIIGRSLPLEEDAATAKQPAPKGSGSPILGMVLADLTNRALEGKEKYGEPLLAHNGRNPLWDAYQEALDLAMYLRQAIEEQKKC